MFTNIDTQAVHESALEVPSINKLSAKTKQKSRLSFYVGFSLASLLIIQYYYPIKINDLIVLQNNNYYKQATGFLILLLVFFEWRITHLKNTNQNKKLKSAFNSHQWMGAFVPVFIFAHSTETGYGHQSILLYSFIALIVVGLFNYQTFKFGSKWYINCWIVLHISLATICLILISYHAYITYTYS